MTPSLARAHGAALNQRVPPQPTVKQPPSLRREHGVRVQIGGSDQWGNITAGTDLIRRLLGGGAGAASVSSYGSIDSSSGGGAEGEGDGEAGGGGQEAPACFGLTFPLLVGFPAGTGVAQHGSSWRGVSEAGRRVASVLPLRRGSTVRSPPAPSSRGHIARRRALAAALLLQRPAPTPPPPPPPPGVMQNSGSISATAALVSHHISTYPILSYPNIFLPR